MIKTEKEVDEKVKEIMTLFDRWSVISITEALNDTLVFVRRSASVAIRQSPHKVIDILSRDNKI